MTMDKSLKIRLGLARARSVLSRAERIQRLKAADRWQEGDSPFGLAKVRVYKLAMKKKKKKKEEEGEEGADGAAPAAGAGAADAAKKPEAGRKEAGKKEGGKKEGGKK
jgi:small basic protein (TIGR04137 family)